MPSLLVSVFPRRTFLHQQDRYLMCISLLKPGFDSHRSACQVHTNGQSCLHSAAPVTAAWTSDRPVQSSATLSVLTASATKDTSSPWLPTELLTSLVNTVCESVFLLNSFLNVLNMKLECSNGSLWGYFYQHRGQRSQLHIGFSFKCSDTTARKRRRKRNTSMTAPSDMVQYK